MPSTRPLALAASFLALASLAGCANNRIPRAPTTQPSANPWRPYQGGQFRAFDSYEAGPKHPVRAIGGAATLPTSTAVDPVSLRAERRVSTRDRVFEGDQFSVNYVVVLMSPMGRVEILESNAQNVLTQIDRLADRNTGLDEARIEFGDGNWSVIVITRGQGNVPDDEVRVITGDLSKSTTTLRFRAKEFRSALVESLRDIEKIKRQAIVAP